MNKILLPVIILFIITGCTIKKDTNTSLVHFKYADSLIKDKDYFTARDYVADKSNYLNKYHSLLLEANISNTFNRPAVSNEKIKRLLKEYELQLSDSVKLKLLELKQANHARLYEYTEANKTINEILDKYVLLLPAEEVADHKNTGILWASLSGQPKQEIIIPGTEVLEITRDKADLANLRVGNGTVFTDFVFDTGANISTVTKTTAVRFNMKFLEGSIKVGAITGAEVNSQLAICPEFTLGNIKVKNAVFLVFPDEALAFPQIGYQINGIIGFPVIEAMKEIQVTSNDEFIVPKQHTVYKKQNMALDFLNPVLELNDEQYTFDTGADGTSLYKKYFNKHKNSIVENYQQTNLNFGGAGGTAEKRGYVITFETEFENRQIKIDSVQVFIEDIEEKENHFYGNIGQDFIKQFKKMTINFEAMFLKFD